MKTVQIQKHQGIETPLEKVLKYRKTLTGFVILGAMIGIWNSLYKGGEDFRVFYYAWKLVLNGEAGRIYSESPDRFLYAPAFAWIFAPLAWFPEKLALLFWTLFKVFPFFFILKGLLQDSHRRRDQAVYFFSILLCSKFVWIDLQYGQVNLFLLGFVWLAWIRPTVANWFLAILWIIAKPTMAPVALSIFFLKDKISKKNASIGAFAAIALVGTAPFLFENPLNAIALWKNWIHAIGQKGIPLDTHNQSALAVMIRTFTDVSVQSLVLGKLESFFFFVIERTWIDLFFSTFLIGLSAFVVKRFRSGEVSTDLKFSILMMSFLLNHLVWKPYFVFCIPALFYGFRAFEKKSNPLFFMVCSFFAASGFITPDLLPRPWIAGFEAYGYYLFLGLGLVIAALLPLKKDSSDFK